MIRMMPRTMRIGSIGPSCPIADLLRQGCSPPTISQRHDLTGITDVMRRRVVTIENLRHTDWRTAGREDRGPPYQCAQRRYLFTSGHEQDARGRCSQYRD